MAVQPLGTYTVVSQTSAEPRDTRLISQEREQLIEYAVSSPSVLHRWQRLASRPVLLLLAAACSATLLVCALPRFASAGPERSEVPTDSSSHSLELEGKVATRAPQFLKIPKGSCKEFGWRTITAASTCEYAADRLGLRITEAREMRLPEWPDGCHYYQNFAREGAEMLFVNKNPLGSNVADEGEIARMGLRESLCEAPQPSTTSRVSEVVQPLEAQTESVAPPAPSTTTEDSLAAVPDQEVRCSFVVGKMGENMCPEGSVPLIESECRNMPYHFGGILQTPFEEDSAEDPAGCFFFSPKYYYNIHPVGGKRSTRTPYCKRCNIKGLNDETGDWSDWGGGEAPRVSSRYRKTEIGNCGDISWHPIHGKAACEEAALELGLGNLHAATTTLEERPEGCYYFRNYQDGTNTLWINPNPYSAGNGAETSYVAKGMLRQPICRLHRARSTAPSSTVTNGGVVEMPLTGALANLNVPTTTTYTTTFKRSKFRKIKKGTCKDFDMDPIKDQVTCEEAAKAIGLMDTVPEMVMETTSNRPEGCYYFRNNQDLTATLWLNPNPLSEGLGTETSDLSEGLIRQPVCTRAHEQDVIPTSSHFKMIKTGRCADLGLHPIHEPGKCETAARELSLVRGAGPGSGPLAHGAPIVASLNASPEGCYYFWNSQDGTATLWLNDNPASKGSGAESSDPSKGLLRQPLCTSSGSDGPEMPAPTQPQTTTPALKIRAVAVPTTSAVDSNTLAALQNSMAAAAMAAAARWTTPAPQTMIIGDVNV
jgi:hypothetical protein